MLVESDIQMCIAFLCVLCVHSDDSKSTSSTEDDSFNVDILYEFDPVSNEIDCPRDGDIWLLQKYVPWGSANRAHRTFPDGMYLRSSTIPGAGLGVFTSQFVKKGTWLGEYEGEVIVNDTHISDYAWMITRVSEAYHYIDGYYIHTSNWLRWVNCPNNYYQENVDMIMCHGKIYYMLKKDIYPGQELLVFYGNVYAKTLNISMKTYYDKPVKTCTNSSKTKLDGC